MCGAEYSSEKVVVSGNIITSKGPGTAIDFALSIIEYLKGGQKSAEIASQPLYQ